jgi:hypothetical protein
MTDDNPELPRNFLQLTLEAAFDLHDLLPSCTFDRICRVNVEVFLDDTEEVVSLHVHYFLSPGNGHDLALDL